MRDKRAIYQYPLKTRGYPIKVDILVIYSPKQLKAVAHQPEGHPNVKRDGFVSKDPTNKSAAVLGIIKILS